MFTNFEIMPSLSMPKIYFFFQDIKLSIPNKKKLMEFIELIFKKERKNLDSINYVFCSDEFLLEINRQFLGRSYYTDVISFDLSEIKNKIQAEIYISIPRVRENAKIFKTSFKSELYRVIFHGALHLCGYSDKTNYKIKKMRDLENRYLKKYNNECSM